MKLKIFYSWQSTTAGKYNRYFILDCIKEAVKGLTKEIEFKDVEFEIQDGVRHEPGSPAVASKIADERIPQCNIFIADLSVVNSEFPEDIPHEILEKIKAATKPFQNNNVIYEYGIAYNVLSVEAIIGVLNKSYGSPKDNPSNIPFDLSHLRFPIEYDYSVKNENKEARKELIKDLVEAIKDTAIYALKHQKQKYRPFLPWQEWEKNVITTVKYYTNEKITEVSNLLIEALKTPQRIIRFLGLSGLGKTRILFEIFRATEETHDSIIRSSRVLYFNLNDNENAELPAIIKTIIDNGEDSILIIDNCPKEKCRNLVSLIKRSDSKVSLITVDSNPEEFETDKIAAADYYIIKKDDLKSIVENIIKDDLTGLTSENIEKIKEFSQGIPMMTVLLVDSVRKGETFIGRLEDKDLLDKLLGSKGKESRNRIILKSCSLFNFIGFYEDVRTQMEYIITNKEITPIDSSKEVLMTELLEISNHYIKRQIFEKRGRYISMRPFPLSISLTQEWLETCTPEKLLNIIESIAKLKEPDRSQLANAMSDQMKFLGFSDKAQTIVENIIGPKSPFDNAEVLNTELGSRLFRSFVEVNPVAVNNNFYRNFYNKSEDELFSISEGRRNLVWALEKLCFDKRTFTDSAKILYSFAVAENESWANNATGQFLHLFNIHLPGTEADLEERLNIIKWGLQRNNSKYFEIGLSAISIGLNFGHFSRAGGAEQQGTKRLYDFEPTRKEVEQYWTQLLQMLLSIIEEKSSYSEFASDIVANAIRSIARAGMFEVILPFIHKIAALKNNDWDKAFSELKIVQQYDKSYLKESSEKEIDSLILQLTKNDFKTRYQNMIQFYRLDYSDRKSPEKFKDVVKNLAEEFIESDYDWHEYFNIFYKRSQIYGFQFGKHLNSTIKNDKSKIQLFLEVSIQTILSLNENERDLAVLGGFLSELDEVTKEEFFYSTIKQDDKLRKYLFYFIALEKPSLQKLPVLFFFVDTGLCSVNEFKIFEHRKYLADFSAEELIVFCGKLVSYGKEGCEVLFNLLHECLDDSPKPKKDHIITWIKVCIEQIGFERNNLNQLDSFRWQMAIVSILKETNQTEFAQFINKSIINSITIHQSYHLDFEIQNIYEILIKNYLEPIWPDLSKAILSEKEEYMKFYGLKHILGSHIGGVGRSVGVLFEGDMNFIFEWCRKNVPLAPTRIAELTPIFDNKNTNEQNWHPVAKRLIDEFGNIESVLSHLGTNMGNYSWIGSVVPLLESEKKLFESLLNHSIDLVSTWAKRNIMYLGEEIKAEKNRDEEWNIL